MPDSSNFHDPEHLQSIAKYNLTMNVSELQVQQKALEQELEDLRIKIETNNAQAQEQIRNLEKSISGVRDLARDAMHVSVGVDGKNGLRGSIEGLVRDVSSINESFHVLKQSANSYQDMKSLMLRLFAASAFTLFCQFGGAVWLVSSLHSRQESMREDLNRVLALLDKQKSEPPSKMLIK